MLQRSLALLLSALLVSAPAYASLTSGLIANYSFNGHTNDISGNANHGSPVGGFGFAGDRFGNPGAAGEFNGLNSYVLVPDSPSLSSPDSACTQAAWVLLYGPSLVGTGFGPITMKSASLENAFMYRLLASQAGFGSAFNNWFTHVTTQHALELNRWYHVATVFDGSTVRAFLDGAPVDTVPMALTIVQDARPLTIGADIPGILEIFNGRLDDVRIYDRALGNDEIADLHGNTVGVGAGAAPGGVALGAPSPNPASGPTHLAFTLDSPLPVRLAVHDASGRLIRILTRDFMPAGRHFAVWDGLDARGRPAPVGVYVVHLVAGSQNLSRRVVRTR